VGRSGTLRRHRVGAARVLGQHRAARRWGAGISWAPGGTRPGLKHGRRFSSSSRLSASRRP